MLQVNTVIALIIVVEMFMNGPELISASLQFILV